MASNEAPSASETTTFRAARGVAPSAWIMALPWIVRAPIIFLYVDILEPEDDFLTQLRKLVCAVCVFISGCPVASVAYNWFTIDVNDVSSGSIVARGCGLFMPVSWIGSYLLFRCTRLESATVAFIFAFSTWIELFLVAVSYIDWPQKESMLLLALISQLLRVPKLPLILTLCCIGHVVASHNSNAFEYSTPEVPLWAFPGAIMRHYGSRMLQAMVSLSSVFIALAALQLQLFESDKLTNQAQASSALALEVAQRLGEYDTEGAMELLGEATGEVDEKLLESMTVLVDNLNKYRPHLPNWMLPQDQQQHRRGKKSKHGDVDDTSSNYSSAASNRRKERDDISVRSSLRSRRSQGSNKAATAPSTCAGTPSASPDWFRGGQPFESFVSIATLVHNFQVSPSQEAVSTFVDLVHKLASQTSAAVHSFVGDAVVLSWNAASRAVQSEAKAARMVARIQAAAATETQQLSLYGAIVSGKMRVQLAGGADGRQQALTVGAPWLAARTRCTMDIGRRHACVAVDTATRSGASHAAHHAAIAAVELPDASADSSGRLGVYRLVSEAKEDDTDEWMYVLAQHERGGGGGGNQAVEGWSEHSLLKALDLWSKGEDAAARVALGGAFAAASSQPFTTLFNRAVDSKVVE